MEEIIKQLGDEIKKLCTALDSQHHPDTIQLIFVLGQQSAGKTTLLSQTGLTEATTVANDYHITLWHDNDSILIELPEALLFQHDNALHQLAKKLTKCHRKLYFHSLILCLSAHECITEPNFLANQATLLNLCRENVTTPVNFALMLTKMDSLAGFCEFFEQEQAVEHNKALGYSLNPLLTLPDLKKLSVKKFNLLTKSLHHKVIKKLHSTRNNFKRHLIREFPLQLEQLKNVLTLIDKLPSQLKLSGIYFSSARQQGNSISHLNSTIERHYALDLPLNITQADNDRVYFVKDALYDILQLKPQVTPKNTTNHLKLIGGVSAAMALLLTGLGYQHFKSSKLIDITNQELAYYQNLINDPSKFNQALLHLTKAESALEEPNYILLPSSQLTQLKNQIQQDYRIQLKQQFMPRLLQQVEQVLTNQHTTIVDKYQALKIYLMLSSPQRLDSRLVKSWYGNLWNKFLDKKQIAQQQKLLSQSLKKPYQPIVINQALVNDIRNLLTAIPQDYLYFMLIKSQLVENSIQVETPGFLNKSQKIPLHYTQQHFKNIVEKQIPQMLKNLQQEYWVLGNTRLNLNRLNKALVERYCNDYVSWWTAFSERLIPQNFDNYQQAATVFKQLAQSDSLTLLIGLMKQNTKPLPPTSPDANLFNQKIAKKFTSINLLSESNVQALMKNLSELANYFSTLSFSNDDQTAFDIAKSRFQNPVTNDPLSALYANAKQLPAPLNHWLDQLANNAWSLIIGQAKIHINNQWQNSVYAFYQQRINAHYPLSELSDGNEIKLEDFNSFFATGGQLNRFFTTYIKPFLNTESAEWKPKQVNDLIMPIQADTITEFVRANVIRQMFFNTLGHQATIHFKLRKLALDPVVAQFRLTIGENQLVDNQASESAKDFVWPSGTVKIEIFSIDGKHYEVTEQGDWALFKLLEQLNIAADPDDTSHFQIVFDINGNGGKYSLLADNSLNPFIPGILKEFTLNPKVI